MAGGTRDGAVGGALGGGGREGEVVPDLAGEAHALPRIGLFRRRSGLGDGCCGRRRSRARREEIGDGVVEPMWVHGVPGAQEDDVAHEDLVFECGAKMAFGFRKRLLDLASYA